jgi:methanogenic corrinoid protein MtbC1
MDHPISTLAHLLLEGNQQKVMEFMKKQGDLSRLDMCHQLFTAAMHYIGDLWENNEITVADEHLATATCDFVLSRLLYSPPQAVQPLKSGKAMFLCVEGEQHYLGLKMVNGLFEEEGWETKYFGPNLPLEHALSKAKEWEPNVVGLSFSIVHHLPQLKHYVRKLSQLPNQPTILIGGRLASRHDLLADCADKAFIVHDLEELKDWLIQYKEKGEFDAIFQ